MSGDPVVIDTGITPDPGAAALAADAPLIALAELTPEERARDEYEQALLEQVIGASSASPEAITELRGIWNSYRVARHSLIIAVRGRQIINGMRNALPCPWSSREEFDSAYKRFKGNRKAMAAHFGVSIPTLRDHFPPELRKSR